MADSAETAAEATQVTFKVKSSSDKTHTITMADSATVLDLKTKLAGSDFEDIPVERQRLIYSGRVMKNDDALGVYKIKSQNTIHMVKSAASNPAPAPGAASTPTPQAIPQNMAAGASANNLLAGLTGARFAGHANLPSRDLFGADGGMGAPPSEDQMADMLSNPAIAQSMSEALNNPAFVDHMLQSNPMLARIPNARELLQSPYFRNMLTNPEALRQAARIRRMMGQGGELPAFPAPGVTDTTPDAPGGEPASGGPSNPWLFDVPIASLRAQMRPASATSAASATPSQATAPAESRDGAAGATPGTQPEAGNTAQQPPNPFAALFGVAPGGQAANPASPFGLPPMSPEATQQMMQLFGVSPASPVTPPDNRPPEERYAEQLRQLNDMGFFDFDRNIAALRRSGGSVQGAIEHLLNGS